MLAQVQKLAASSSLDCYPCCLLEEWMHLENLASFRLPNYIHTGVSHHQLRRRCGLSIISYPWIQSNCRSVKKISRFIVDFKLYCRLDYDVAYHISGRGHKTEGNRQARTIIEPPSSKRRSCHAGFWFQALWCNIPMFSTNFTDLDDIPV